MNHIFLYIRLNLYGHTRVSNIILIGCLCVIVLLLFLYTILLIAKKKKIQELNSEIKDLTESNYASHKEVRQLTSKISSMQKTHEDTLKKYKFQIAQTKEDFTEKVQSLTNEVKEKNKEISNLHRVCKEYSDSIKSEQLARIESQKRISILEKEVERLNQLNDKQANSYYSLRVEWDELHKNLTSTIAKLNRRDEKIESLKSQMLIKNESITELQKKTEDLQTLLEGTKKELIESKDCIKQLEEKISTQEEFRCSNPFEKLANW